MDWRSLILADFIIKKKNKKVSKLSLAVWEIGVCRRNGGPIKDSPQTSQYGSALMSGWGFRGGRGLSMKLGTPLKPFNTVVLWCPGGYRGEPRLSMMLRDARLSDSHASDRWRALSSLRGLRGAPEVPPLCRETQSLGQQMLERWAKNGLKVRPVQSGKVKEHS